MAINLKGRSFLTLADFTPAEIRYLLDLGHDLKAKRRAGVCAPTMQGKHIVLLFEKTGAYSMAEGIAMFLSRELPEVYLKKENGEVVCVRKTFETSDLNTPDY